MSQSLERGLAVLTRLGEGSHTLDELAESLGVHKSTVLRLLRSLETARFVRRADTHHYRLGSALFDLANQALEDLDARDAARPHLVALGEHSGHTIHLATFEADQAVYIDKVDSRHPVRMYSRIGKRAPLHCTAVGKVLVAEWAPRQRRELAERLTYPRLTAETITDADRFLGELDRVRAQGYAVDSGEHEDFVHCIAAPVHDSRGEVVAAMSLSAPKVLLDFDDLLELLGELLRTTRRVSAELGWREPGTRTTNGKEDR